MNLVASSWWFSRGSHENPIFSHASFVKLRNNHDSFLIEFRTLHMTTGKVQSLGKLSHTTHQMQKWYEWHVSVGFKHLISKCRGYPSAIRSRWQCGETTEAQWQQRGRCKFRKTYYWLRRWHPAGIHSPSQLKSKWLKSTWWRRIFVISVHVFKARPTLDDSVVGSRCFMCYVQALASSRPQDCALLWYFELRHHAHSIH